MTPSEPILDDAAWSVTEIDVTGSTNDDLLSAAARGDLRDRTVLRTDHQTSGRGRLDRRWEAPPGANLLASAYLAGFGDQPGAAVQRVGVALVDAIDEVLLTQVPNAADRPVVGLKWPNDVLLGGRKLAGVLAQRSSDAPGVVVGFGVNVGWAPSDASRLADFVDCEPAELLRVVLGAFDALPDDEATFSSRYRERLLTLGQRVRIHLPGGADFTGTATDLDAVGRIVVTSIGGERQAFDVGDVVHLRPAD